MVIFFVWVDFFPLEQKNSQKKKTKNKKQNKLEWHKKACENKDFCNVIMPSEEIKISQFNQNQFNQKHHLSFLLILNVQ